MFVPMCRRSNRVLLFAEFQRCTPVCLVSLLPCSQWTMDPSVEDTFSSHVKFALYSEKMIAIFFAILWVIFKTPYL